MGQGRGIARDDARAAGQALAEILEALCRLVAPGVTSATLEAHARALVARAGAEPAFLGYQPEGAPYPYPAVLNVSVNEVAAHGIPTQPVRTFREGDIVKIDLGIRLRGVVVDAARSVIAGRGSRAARRLVEAARGACEAGIAALRPGAPLSDVARAVEAVAKEWGVRVIAELGGHGVGRSVHEEPFVPLSTLLPPSAERVRAGMMLAIEPHITSGKGRIRTLPDGYAYVTTDRAPVAVWEETVWVGEEGPEVLTRLPTR